MPKSIEMFLRIETSYPGWGNGLEWLSLEAYLDFLTKQLHEAERLFRDKAEQEYKKECDDIIRISREQGLDPREDLAVLRYEYDSQKKIEERHISDKAWCSFLPIVWSVFEKQYLEFLCWAHDKNNPGKEFNKHKYRNKGNLTEQLQFLYADIGIGILQANWEYLRGVYLLRNAIVHGNGSICELNKEQDRTDLLSFVDSHSNLHRDGKIIALGSEFAKESFSVCRSTIKKLDSSLISHYYGE
ncbi:MAG: hypothetical protein IPM89_12300 [Candidatus Competibacteraceae bacterium]|nr:MAG: hypothetical protein IPM89_12300 [Candidatus Competibacteraceae bacterium]